MKGQSIFVFQTLSYVCNIILVLRCYFYRTLSIKNSRLIIELFTPPVCHSYKLCVMNVMMRYDEVIFSSCIKLLHSHRCVQSFVLIYICFFSLILLATSCNHLVIMLPPFCEVMSGSSGGRSIQIINFSKSNNTSL